MRSSLILSLTLLAVTVRAEELAVVPGAAPGAQPTAEDRKGAPAGHRLHQEMLKRFDKNGDGKLDEAERAAAKAYHQEHMAELKEKNPELFKKIDQDGDGTISPEELRRAHELRKDGPPDGARKEGMLKRFDADGDGKLNDTEKAAMETAMKERMDEMKEKHPELFKRLDQDGDGKLSPEEMRRAHGLRQDGPQVGRRKDELTQRFDTDGDGTLSESEKSAMKAHFVEMKEKHPEIFKKIDKNGDGTISIEEMRAHRQKGKDGSQADGGRP